MDEKITDNLKKILAQKKWVQMAFLFGSEAKNRAMPESDVDIAIWPESGYRMEDIDLLWNELERASGKDVDLIRLNEAKPTVAWAAMRGRPLLIRDKKFFVDNMLEISREAEDMQDFILELWALKEKHREVRNK